MGLDRELIPNYLARSRKAAGGVRKEVNMLWAQLAFLIIWTALLTRAGCIGSTATRKPWEAADAVSALIAWCLTIALLAFTGAFSHLIGWPK
jgi:hypothetical protein